MLFRELIGTGKFAHGVTKYLDNYLGAEERRIVVHVKFADAISTLAIVDTGATTCIFSSEEAAELNLEHDDLEPQVRRIGGTTYSGRHYRLLIAIEAMEGFGITLEAPVFVPELKGSQQPLPNLLGYHGFLERLRFAVDSEYNYFYFASTGGDSE